MYGLLTIIQVLEVIFSQEPPVFAKRPEMTNSVSPANNYSLSQARNHFPNGYGQNVQTAVANQNQKKPSLKSLVRSKYSAPPSGNIPAQLQAPNPQVLYSSYPTSPTSSNSMTLTPEEMQRRYASVQEKNTKFIFVLKRIGRKNQRKN